MAIYNYNTIDPSLYINAVKSKIIRPCFRLSLLNQDESVKEDITEYMILSSGSLSINYQLGTRRSFSCDLNNSTHRFSPSINTIWINTKIKLELGIKINGDEYYNPAGIFLITSVRDTRSGAQETISVDCEDKFSLFTNWTTEATYVIPSGVLIKDAIKGIQLFDNGNTYPIDIKPLIFDSTYKDTETYYTITKNPNDSLGSILIELAEMIGCDIWYDTEGYLNVMSGTQDITDLSKPVLFNYSDNELQYLSSDIQYDFNSVFNRITVVGANTNGANIYFAISENTNPQSPTRISLIGTRNKYYEDSNISSTQLAQDRADYELRRLSIMALSISVNSTYLINLDVNNCITVTDSKRGYFNEKFIIQSINIPIGIDSSITIECSQIRSLPYYPTI